MANDPMVMVSWYGAVAYCNWRSSQEGYETCYNPFTFYCNFNKQGYRLPTEAEWEYAARGGQYNPYYRFPWGNTISHNQANYISSIHSPFDVSITRGYHPAYNDGIPPYTAPVGSFPTNSYGVYDMAGNVLEWCNDMFDYNYYEISPYDNPTGPENGSGSFTQRGGCWSDDEAICRVSSRSSYYPRATLPGCGFRVVLKIY